MIQMNVVCKHTISQSMAYIGDSGDFLDLLNGLVEIKPKNKENGIKLRDIHCTVYDMLRSLFTAKYTRVCREKK